MSSSGGDAITPVLAVEHLSAGYGILQILWDVNLTVRPHECMLLLGANGSGKTTLLRAILGLIPVKDGRILLEGRPITQARPHERVRAGIGYMPETGVFPTLDIRENLALGGHYLPRGEARRRMADLFERFPDLARRPRTLAANLSGGQRKMLGIAKALMSRPRLIILDEPSSGLSPRYVKEVLATLRALRSEGLSFLIAEQNLGFLDLADRACVLEGGHTVLEDRVEALRDNPLVRRSYFGSSASKERSEGT
ncbi:MAG: ABC transporter ATP-binding protein [Acidiferrobacteraceae bacterium]